MADAWSGSPETFRGLAGPPHPTPLFSSISLLEIGRKDEQSLLRDDRFERRPLTGSAIKTHQDSFLCVSWCCAEIREREWEDFKKRGKERVGERLDRDFSKQGLERGGGEIFEWIDG